MKAYISLLCFSLLLLISLPVSASNSNNDDEAELAKSACAKDFIEWFEASKGTPKELEGAFQYLLELEFYGLGCMSALLAEFTFPEYLSNGEKNIITITNSKYVQNNIVRITWLFNKILSLAEESKTYKTQAYDYYMIGLANLILSNNYKLHNNKTGAKEASSASMKHFQRVLSFGNYNGTESKDLNFVASAAYYSFRMSFSACENTWDKDLYALCASHYESLIEYIDLCDSICKTPITFDDMDAVHFNACAVHHHLENYSRVLEINTLRFSANGELDKSKIKKIKPIEVLSILSASVYSGGKIPPLVNYILNERALSKKIKPNATSEKIRKKFINEQMEKILGLVGKVCNFNHKPYLNNENCMDVCKDVLDLKDKANKLKNKAKTFKGKSKADDVEKIRELCDEAGLLVKGLEGAEKSLKRILKAEKKGVKEEGHTPVLNFGSGAQIKKPVLQPTKEKTKTKGKASVISDSDSDDSSDEEKNTNSISSFSNSPNGKMAMFIFRGFKSDTMPERTIDCLKVLNESKNLADLKEKLTKGNDLKKLDGANENVWAFRINDQYRVHFEIDEANGGFKNVEVGDYH